ncbi:MAG TPA: hypothetical protein ENI39_06930 [Anaerolineae bacterium]|nr:hypothetical protein [Anaerolineae bacterium]
MANESIEISKEGIKFSYKRFLSDSAPGYILILLTIWAYYSNYPIFGMQLRNLLPPPVLTEVKLFILLLLFLLAMPIGLTVNVLSWTLLEVPQKWMERWIFNGKISKRIPFFGFRAFKEEYLFEKCTVAMNINSDNWFERVRALETALMSEYPGVAERIDPHRGMAILLRNLSLLFLVSIVLGWPRGTGWQKSLLLFGLSFGSLLASAVLSFYFHMHIAYWGYLLSRKKAEGILHDAAIGGYN